MKKESKEAAQETEFLQTLDLDALYLCRFGVDDFTGRLRVTDWRFEELDRVVDFLAEQADREVVAAVEEPFCAKIVVRHVGRENTRVTARQVGL